MYQMVNKQKKKKGFMLFSAVLSSIVFLMLAGAFFTLYGGQFSMIKNGNTALQARQYAEIDANTLSLLSYNDLDSKGAHARKAITNIANASGWEDEVIIGAEQIIDSNNKQRIATLNIYKTGDPQPRYTLQVPLSSQESGSGIPSGTIIIWSGSIATIPLGYHLCDGTNGTPDLRTRFILGAGSDSLNVTNWPSGWDIKPSGYYNPGFTGGEWSHVITIAEMPNHNHAQIFGQNGYPLRGANLSNGWNPLGGSGIEVSAGGSGVQISTSFTGGSQPHNNIPLFYSLAYIMKL